MALTARAKTRPATIADVARLANVVPSTVSHALNGTAPISAEVRERILRIARELNYRPNAAARSLLSGRTMTVGMLVADILDPNCPDVVDGVEAALARARHNLLLCSAAGSADRMTAFLTSLGSKCVDAVIVVTDGLSAQTLASVAEAPVPTVLVSSAGAAGVGVHLTPNLMAGLRAASQHLRGLGHQNVALMIDEASGSDSHEGIAIAAWEQSGGARQDLLVVQGTAGLDGGRMALETVLAARPRPTALIAASDMAAIGVIQAAEEQGLRIPQFLSVVGIGDIVPASLVNPPLTTLALPRRDIGVAAVERALAVLDGEVPREDTAREWLPTSLVIRRSTGAPPRM